MPNPVLTEAIDTLAAGTDLSADQAARVLHEIMAGGASEVQTAGFLVALRAKGERAAELVGLARTLREFADHVDVDREDLLDTAGTGGGAPTFNVSTAAALIAAAAGCAVAKHGNRSATSLCGSADVLEAFGARIDLGPDAVAQCIERIGFGFMFAPVHHAATRHVVPVRRELAVRTIFNFLGPLTNPAGATRQLVGVSDPNYVEIMAQALAELHCRKAMVVCSEDGLDELSVSAPTQVFEVDDGEIGSYALVPEDVGLARAPLSEVAGGDPDESAGLLREVLDGAEGARRSLAVLNAGAAIYVAGHAETVAEGVRAAEQAIDSGAALAKLEEFVQLTQDL